MLPNIAADREPADRCAESAIIAERAVEPAIDVRPRMKSWVVGCAQHYKITVEFTVATV